MSLLLIVALFCLLILFELLYFKIADRYDIIDHPNHRSSHTSITIRGGGILFVFAILLCSIYLKWAYSYFVIGLLLISLISFIDDIKTISNKIRICFHLSSVILLFVQLGMYSLPIYIILAAIVLVIGIINAINFMDGINGITGGYGLITLLTFYYINNQVLEFTESSYLISSIISVIVFNFFNFRNKAKCFAGDIGSVSLAFIIIFFLLQLIIKTSNLNYLLILLVYGLDTATTIMFRAFRKENIFKAHRSHFYQFWANEKHIPHLVVTVVYVVVQAIINFILIKFNPISIVNLILYVALTAIIFILVRIHFEGVNKLFDIKKTQ